MISVASAEKALLGRYSPYKNGNFRTAFIGADRHRLEAEPDRTALSPVAYLVEQGPHKELRAHYHVANQFQVFVSGDGRIGGHRAAVGVGHFAGPYTAYGPIVGGEHGVGYMTLRNAWDDGAQFLPDKMAAFRPHRHLRREVMFGSTAPVAAAALAQLHENAIASLIAPREDGLAAWSYALPPGGRATGPVPASGGGQYWLVMGGALMHASEGPLGPKSVAFIPPDEAPFAAEAGPEGLSVMVMQFPVFRRH